MTPDARPVDTAARQLRRILDVLPRIADGEFHRLDEIERRDEVNAATLVKDLRSLSERDDAQDIAAWTESVQIYLESDRVQLVTSQFRRPMRVTRGELAALELGLAMLRGERPEAEHAAIDGARTRLQEALAVLPDEEPAPADRVATSPSSGDARTFATLREALQARRVARIAYRRSGSTTDEPRDVRPYALAAARDAWYLVAHCERSGEPRIFRLDRMAAAEVLEARYEIPGDFSLDDWVQGGEAFRAAHAGTLRIRYGPRVARWIAEREGRTTDADGSITVDHPLADESWAVRHALQYGADAEVLEPASVREEIVRRMQSLVGR
jgi:predicted DNA-binding transcriptional regulator YafY